MKAIKIKHIVAKVGSRYPKSTYYAIHAKTISGKARPMLAVLSNRFWR